MLDCQLLIAPRPCYVSAIFGAAEGKPMKNNRRYWGLLPTLPGAVLAQVVKEAEAIGMEGLWVPQLYGPPFITLAAAAMASQRLKLGTGVALAFTRSPLETALSAIDLDIISGGRAVLGIGTSLRWLNEACHGASTAIR
jgi:alkanesulfonate monooxygenase SsuD/methylene tetrahydromethanopterin reductase-like flavin-dependent oxidoreductase (luciferase family)